MLIDNQVSIHYVSFCIRPLFARLDIRVSFFTCIHVAGKVFNRYHSHFFTFLKLEIILTIK